MIQILLLVGIVFFTMLAVRRYLRTAPADAAKKLRRTLLFGGLLLGLALVASGRLAFLVPLIGAFVVSLIRFLPMLLPLLIRAIPIWQQQQRQQRTRANPGGGADASTVESRFLRMRLDHRNGEIGGEVLAGRYAGRQLAELDRAQLTDLYAECAQGDQESATLLRAYLERVFGEAWEDAGEETESSSSSSGKMTAAEAYEVLGLAKGASRDEIVAAHRRLMQRLHPDRGGSDYLAAKINQAKDVLLG